MKLTSRKKDEPRKRFILNLVPRYERDYMVGSYSRFSTAMAAAEIQEISSIHGPWEKAFIIEDTHTGWVYDGEFNTPFDDPKHPVWVHMEEHAPFLRELHRKRVANLYSDEDDE